MKLSTQELKLLIAIIKPWEPSEDWTKEDLKSVEMLMEKIIKEYFRLGGE